MFSEVEDGVREECNARNGERMAGDASRARSHKSLLCHGQEFRLDLEVTNRRVLRKGRGWWKTICYSLPIKCRR